MKQAFRTAQELCEEVGISVEELGIQAEKEFPVFVPREFAAKIEAGNAKDPLLLQVLASGAELAPGGSMDAVGDEQAQLAPGILQKYRSRCLVISTGVCAIHCRYCFRRHFPYETAPKGSDGLMKAVEAIAADRSIEEVILSGGDPLTLVDAALSKFVDSVHSIEHVRRIRFHTRVPGVIPSRVCEQMLRWVERSRLPMVFVTHFNHANEICPAVNDAMRALHRAGATLLNQSVLLRGVNDTTDAQLELCKRLVDVRVMPYYLHQLDRVQGALHFEVPQAVGQRIVQELRSELPGYAIPRYVQEVAGQPSKTPL